MNDVNNSLKNALEAPSNFSEQFTKQVVLLKNNLAAYLKVPVYHDTDMNYKAAEELMICVDEEYQYVECSQKTAKYRLRLFLSSKGNYATIKLNVAIGERIWSFTDWSQSPQKLLVLRDEVYAFLTQYQYEYLPESILEQIVPGHYTTINKQPATVFNVLFAEEY